MGVVRLLPAGVLLAAIAFPTLASADGVVQRPPAPAATPRDSAPSGPAPTVVAARRTSPMMIKVRAALDQEREELAALGARLRLTTDPQVGLALEREIEQVKLGTEIAVLRIQAEAARAAGRAPLAERIEAAAANLLRPAAPAPSAARPASRAIAR